MILLIHVFGLELFVALRVVLGEHELGHATIVQIEGADAPVVEFALKVIGAHVWRVVQLATCVEVEYTLEHVRVAVEVELVGFRVIVVARLKQGFSLKAVRLDQVLETSETRMRQWREQTQEHVELSAFCVENEALLGDGQLLYTAQRVGWLFVVKYQIHIRSGLECARVCVFVSRRRNNIIF